MDRNKRLRSPEETVRERKLGLLFMVVVMIGGCLWDQARAWEVEYNPEGSPIAKAETEEAIQYAIWSLTSRLDLVAPYVGITGAEKTMGRITFQWADLPAMPNGDTQYGYVEWHFYDINGPDVMVRILLDRKSAGSKVDACLRETIVHELTHAFQGHIRGYGPGGHSPNPRDFMHGDRGECRYSPSLSDLAMLGKPLKSCHVELTPDGDLEALDYMGLRIRLAAKGKDRWVMGGKYYNLFPDDDCESVSVQHGDVWINGKSFLLGPVLLRLRQEGGVFKAIPIQF